MQMLDNLLVKPPLCHIGQDVVLRIRVALEIEEEALRRRVVGRKQKSAVLRQHSINGALVRREKKFVTALFRQFFLAFYEQWVSEQRVRSDRAVPQQVVERRRYICESRKVRVIVYQLTTHVGR